MIYCHMKLKTMCLISVCRGHQITTLCGSWKSSQVVSEISYFSCKTVSALMEYVLYLKQMYISRVLTSRNTEGNKSIAVVSGVS